MGLVAAVIAGGVGLAVGIVLAIVISIKSKRTDPDSSLLLAFFVNAFWTVPASAVGAFLLIFWWVSENL
jgi:hypothetical protein